MSETRFLEWNYDEGEVVEYERQGECNSCGDCCKAAIGFAVIWSRGQRYADDHDAHTGGDTTNREGVWNEAQRGNLRRFWKDTEVGVVGSSHCSHLTDDNQCDIQAAKGLYNKMWPMTPRQVVPFERCSFTFAEVGRWPIEGDNE